MWQLLPSLASRLKTSKGRGARRQDRSRSRRLQLEILEDRTVPSALPLNFKIDQAASVVTASGTAAGLGTVVQQGSGSLTTHFTGKISTSWDQDSATLTINPSGTEAVATNSGNWAPKTNGDDGTESANFGGRINAGLFVVNLAVRGAKLQVNTPSAASLTDSGDGKTFSFDATLVSGGLTAGSLDYRLANVIASGRVALATDLHVNEATDSGTFQARAGGAFHLTLPYQLTISGSFSSVPYTVTMQGTLEADATKPATVNLNGGNTDGNDFSTSAVGGGGPVNIADANAFISVAGNDDIQLTRMTIKLTNPSDDFAEQLAVNLSGIDGLTSIYNTGSHTLTIYASSATAPKSVFETALRNVTFENTLDSATLGDRRIEVTVTDLQGNTSATSISTVTVTTP
jgi:hypothetical protein